MDALDALHQRVSAPKLQAPAPSQSQRQALYQAATRAADHGMMQPWRFLEVEDQGLEALGELFLEAALSDNPDLPEAAREATKSKPQRAPLILVAIASCKDNPKVPHIEQIISAGAAVQNMLNAAFAQGLGAYWRTGGMAYHPIVRQGLGLKNGEELIGFVYLGTPAKPFRTPRPVDSNQFVLPWLGKHCV